MTMIERVARASYDATKESDTSWEDEFQEIKTTFLIQARAAIKAMRDPTDSMIEAGRAALWGNGVDNVVETDATECLRAMIDAALSEKS